MTWPLDVFNDWLVELPLIVAELNGHTDHLKKIANNWAVDEVKCGESLRKIGLSGLWRLNGSGSE